VEDISAEAHAMADFITIFMDGTSDLLVSEFVPLDTAMHLRCACRAIDFVARP
jgi:hypothetical protein